MFLGVLSTWQHSLDEGFGVQPMSGLPTPEGICLKTAKRLLCEVQRFHLLHMFFEETPLTSPPSPPFLTHSLPPCLRESAWRSLSLSLSLFFFLSLSLSLCGSLCETLFDLVLDKRLGDWSLISAVLRKRGGCSAGLGGPDRSIALGYDATGLTPKPMQCGHSKHVLSC